MPGITILGLGPGDASLITREAWDILSSAGVVWLRTREHPAVNGLPPSLEIHSFDDLYRSTDSFEKLYASIADKILALGAAEAGVVYAVPGSPFVAEATSMEIARRARSSGIPLRVVQGLSFLEPTFAALGTDPLPRLSLSDAMTLGVGHVPSFPPDVPALIAQVYSRQLANEVKLVLSEVYPDSHPVSLVHRAGTPEEYVEQLELRAMDRSEHIGALSSAYIPPLEAGTSVEGLQEVVAHLRAPNGCPWDREQTHASLRSHLLEEAYEVLDAMDRSDAAGMREEFGDLLLQIMLNSQIASESGEFNVNQVFKGIHDKIVRRHPHVFGDVKVEGVGGVLKNWERLKEDERAENGAERGLLDGVPASLPALIQSQEIQDRAARVGFDWPEIGGVLDKITEEIEEVRRSSSPEELSDELGDLFFALVNLARWKSADAESALRHTNNKFKRRFSAIEEGARNQGRKLSELGLEEMERLWQAAKEGE
jgi:tetrapyrrole methylase family protein/MazG family protein